MKASRILCWIGAAALCLSFVSCGSDNTQIHVIAREDGSGTRGAFVELLSIEDENGNDAIIPTAEVTNSTAVMLATVAGDKNAIGFVSIASLSESVKAVSVDSAEASVETIQNGTYKIARPFNIVYKEGTLSVQAQDFLHYIMSRDGQAIIAAYGCIASSDAPAYTGSGITGKITISGSTSVAPVMEKLAEAYKNIHTGVEIEIQQPGSGAGIKAAMDGAVDLGMSSRDLKAGEAEKLVCVSIATDGIAVIVHPASRITNLTSDQIRAIFRGEITDWSEIR